MDRRLEKAAQAGDISALYDLIQKDPDILETIENKGFADTPLHTAAAGGHIEFAMEIVNLKPSFARKLNQNGLSPMHLALQNNQRLMVLWLIDVDAELVRVKGRGGMTPLHLAAEQGRLNVLEEFFEACPESIKDVTNQGDTALHITLKIGQIEAFKSLLGWLENFVIKHANFWEIEIMNWKNNEGNTPLHIAALRRQNQAVLLLLVRAVHSDIQNTEGLTAMEILQDQFSARDFETFKSIPKRINNRLFDTRYPIATRRAEDFIPEPPPVFNFGRQWARARQEITSEMRNALLVVDALFATVTYQAALSPPGSVWQGTADINSPMRIASTLSNTTLTSEPRYVGTTVMTKATFEWFYVANTVLFLASIIRMGGQTSLLRGQTSSFLLIFCYSVSMSIISPTKGWSMANVILSVIFAVMSLCFNLYRLDSITKPENKRKSRKPMHTREEWWQQCC